MSYAALEKQIRALPEECLEDVSDYIDFILFKLRKKNEHILTQDTQDFFGALKQLPDGMDLQRSLRNEWT